MKRIRSVTALLGTLSATAAFQIGMLGQAMAQGLPQPVTPTTAPQAGNFIDWLKFWFKDNVDALALIAMAVVFVVAGYIIFMKLVEVRSGRSTFSELIVQGAASAAVAVAAAFFLNQATGVII